MIRFQSINNLVRICLVTSALFLLSACGGSKDDIEDLIDGVDRKPIDTSRMGLNAFGNQAFAGSLCAQYSEILNTLRLSKIRVLFNWDSNVQPTPGSSLNFSFYDDILSCIPAGIDVLVILTNVPSWMQNSANWIGGNPRRTFVEKWVKPAVNRYAGNGKIIAFQIWNEPNNVNFSENTTLDVLQSPENYVELIAMASNAINDINGNILVTNGATTSIAQNFPDSLNYNRALRDAGMFDMVDIYSIHYYGQSFERLVLEVKDFLNSVPRPIWVTESGRMGVDNQLKYVEETWPFLREKVPNIDRIYYYRFAENTPSASTFGLKNPDGAAPVSDLYVYLRDR